LFEEIGSGLTIGGHDHEKCDLLLSQRNTLLPFIVQFLEIPSYYFNTNGFVTISLLIVPF
jgi:hypothetical protein